MDSPLLCKKEAYINSNASISSLPEKKCIRIRSINNAFSNKNFGKSMDGKDQIFDDSNAKLKKNNSFANETQTVKKKNLGFSHDFRTPKACLKTNSQFLHHESIFKPAPEKTKNQILPIVSIKNKKTQEIKVKEEEELNEESPQQTNAIINKKDIYLLQKSIRFIKELHGNLSTRVVKETKSNRYQ